MSDISLSLIERVKTAREEGGSLNIVGLDSKHFFGREAQGDAINIAEHSGIVDYQPIELVMTVRGGTPLTEIKAALEEHNQMLSFEPPSFGAESSIGGTLACNQSGPGRPWGGSVRDMVLGARLINGKAEQLRFGGQVMKNVAGYDVSRLQAGAMGAFGIITEISLKVLPKPATTITLVCELDASEAIQVMNHLAGKAKPLTAACWLNNRLYLRLAGARSAVEGTAKCWQSTLPGGGQQLEHGQQFWSDLRDHQLEFFSKQPLWRFSLQSNAAHFFPEADWLIDWGGAQRWLCGSPLENDSVSSASIMSQMEHSAMQANGQVCLFRGGDRRSEVFHSQANALKTLHQRLKKSFDPDGVFNPGRLYSWL